MLSGHRCSRDIEYFGPARDVVKLEAAEALGMSGGHLPEDPRVRASPPRPASDRAQVRAGAERAMVRYQEPPARFSAPRTRKKAAHP